MLILPHQRESVLSPERSHAERIARVRLAGSPGALVPRLRWERRRVDKLDELQKKTRQFGGLREFN